MEDPPRPENGLGKRRRGESYTWSIECGQIETLDGGKWGEEGVGETIHSSIVKVIVFVPDTHIVCQDTKMVAC